MLENQSPTARGGAGTESNAGNGAHFQQHTSTEAPRLQYTTPTTTPIHSGEKIVGEVRGDTLYKTISGSKHLLRRPPAIAFSIDSLVYAQQAGAKGVRVFDRETRTTYTARLEWIWSRGTETQRGGYERQIYLPLEAWIKTTGEPALQMGLFGQGVHDER